MVMTRISRALRDRQGLYALLRYSTPTKLANLAIAQIQRILRQPSYYQKLWIGEDEKGGVSLG
jgi:hypothetical protein